MTGARRLVLVGATGTGKSAVALAVAASVGGVEIVNADSRQVIRGLETATASPPVDARRRVPHHLYGIRAPSEPFTVADWLGLAGSALAEIDGRGAHALIAGGTGLYVTALVDGLDPLPAPDPVRRRERSALAATAEGRARLVHELTERDATAAAAIDTANPRRVMRALEILDATGGDLAAAWTRRGVPAELPPGVCLIGLDLDREEHRRRLEARTRWMFESGALLAEVERVLADGVAPEVLAASGIGYAEALRLRAGECDAAAAIAATQQRTLRYAKAQRTYFRRDHRIVWLDAAAPAEAVAAQAVRIAAW